MFAATEIRGGDFHMAPVEQRNVLLLTVRDMGNGVFRVEQSAWITESAARGGLHAASQEIPAAVLDVLELIPDGGFDAPCAAYRFLDEGLTEYLIWNE